MDMDKVYEALAGIAAGRAELRRFSAEHRDVIGSYEALKAETERAEAAAKPMLRDCGLKTVEGHGLRVSISHRKPRTIWDADVLLARIPGVREAHPRLFVTTVDAADMQRLIDLRALPEAAVEEARDEEPGGTAAVSIRDAG